jgi:hypothetical protein
MIISRTRRAGCGQARGRTAPAGNQADFPEPYPHSPQKATAARLRGLGREKV